MDSWTELEALCNARYYRNHTHLQFPGTFAYMTSTLFSGWKCGAESHFLFPCELTPSLICLEELFPKDSLLFLRSTQPAQGYRLGDSSWTQEMTQQAEVLTVQVQ